MRGEHVSAPSEEPRPAGSSPHARGAHALGLSGGVLGGIIPACAGSTTPSRTLIKGGRDHPRMRGEHDDAGVLRAVYEGSSPHARGARHRR